jgi:putative ABC transport system substrate-binding protein
MRRRDFFGILSGAAMTWPLAARAQQRERPRRIGVLMNIAADDPESQARIGALVQGLQVLGWNIGRNVRIDYRWVTDFTRLSAVAAELVALAPDVVLANAPPSVMAMQQTTHSVPIVFVAVTDPVAMGIVQSLARPGGNATGFVSAEFGMSAKWLELMKDIAPSVTRVAVVQDPGNSGGISQFAAIQSVAPSLGVTLSALFLRNASEFESAVTAFAREPHAGLIVSRTSGAIVHRDLIIKLAALNRLPTVYPLRPFVTGGGLVCYGPDIADQFRRAAVYVDRILKGEKPADLPVQAPTKYELVINLKTARALGLTLPPTLLARADEVTE